MRILVVSLPLVAPRVLLLVSMAASVPFLRAAANATPLRPVYEEMFNVSHPGLEFKNGATLGGPGTGVSGLKHDFCYMGRPRTTENEPHGPHAVARVPVAPRAESAFTCTFWYLLDEQGPELQVVLNDASVLYLLKADGLELRIQQLAEAPFGANFSPGRRGPYLEWREPGRWIFAAFVWRQEGNTLEVFQATHVDPVAFMRQMNGRLPSPPTLPRPDLARRPEIIGNNLKTDRPLTGRMDNLRHFDQALDLVDLERVRQADLGNRPLLSP